jgi:hypothetical protein
LELYQNIARDVMTLDLGKHDHWPQNVPQFAAHGFLA